jgi:MFS family permease
MLFNFPTWRLRGEGKLFSGAFALVMLATFFEALSFTILFPVLPKFVTGMGGGPTDVGLILGAFNFLAVVSRPISGWSSDRWGRRILMLLGSIGSIAGTVGLLLANSLPVTLVIRIIHGAAESAFFVAAAASATDLAAANRRSEAVSVFSLAFLSAFAIGPMIGDIVSRYSFNAAWISAGLCAAIAVCLSLAIPLPVALSERAAGLKRLVHPRALLPGSLLAVTLLGYAGFAAFISFYAGQIGIWKSGWLFATYGITMAITRVFAGGVPDRLGPSLTGTGAMITAGVGLLLLGAAQTPAVAIGATIVFACGQALCFPSLLLFALDGTADAERGAVVGTFSAFLDIGLTFGSLVFAVLCSPFGISGAFLASGMATLGTAAIYFMLSRTGEPVLIS